jgi:hypothetical protein
MKYLSLFSLLTLFTFSCRKESSTSKNIGYYFCCSHEMNPKEESTITYILYTDILKIEGDDLVIKEKASDWGTFVNNQCKNKSGCTSDLMYYYTIEEAEANRNEMFEIYKNPEKHQLEKISFK